MIMIKTMFAFGALALVVAAPAAAQMAAATLPKCSATVRDSCDQSMTSEKYAISAEQAMKTGGVGDRASDKSAMMPMGGKPMMMHHKKHMMHHHMMMKKSAPIAADTPAADPMPK
jgi:hypothetical protein